MRSEPVTPEDLYGMPKVQANPSFVQGRPIARRILLMPLLDPPIAREATNITPLLQRQDSRWIN